jgi:DNA-binding Lrp family transcriptional regulator
MDEATKNILLYFNKNTFGTNYVLTCIADIARAVGNNPRTIQSRLKKLMEDKVITIEDCYPRTGRAMAFVYHLDRSKASALFHQDQHVGASL